MIENFDALSINTTLVNALKIENITIPTEVQQKSIPKALENKDLIVQSETGTGKTLAYLLPLYQKIDVSKKEMQAIILVPTHELAIQIMRQIEKLTQNSDIKASATTIIGNVNIDRQLEKLKQKPNIIVGSPGRVLELIKKRKIAAHTVKTIILDEADRLMDENNIDSVKAIIKSTLKERQLMMFSASISKESVEKGKEIMKDPEIIMGESKPSVPSTIEHLCFFSEQRDKIDVLRKLVRIINPQKALVFVNKSNDIETITEKLQYHGLKAESIQGSKIKSDRKKAMEDFRTGKIQLLIASDIAARGLDIEGVTHIFNADVPEGVMEYLHRVGRTGRNGNKGVAISIATNKELSLIKLIESKLKIKIMTKDMYEGKIIDAKKPAAEKPATETRRKYNSGRNKSR